MIRLGRSVLIPLFTLLIGGAMVAYSLAAADDVPAAEPSTQPAEVTADAAPLLQKLADAYTELKSLELTGTLAGDFDVDGQTSQQKVETTATFAAPNQFRHAIKHDELTVGSTGEQLFVYEAPRQLYKTAEAPRARTQVAELPEPFGTILLDQNLSLALALSSDPAADLRGMYQKIDKADEVTIDGAAHPALRLSNPQETVTLALDPQTNLIRRATVDLTQAIRQRGAQDVNRAVVTMDYPTSKAGVEAKPEQFAWAPPAGARDVATIQPTGGEMTIAAAAMEGKPAPDFALKDINGKEVKFADLKGDVLVLDFWATWCPPCVAAMPGLDKLAAEKKAQGLKVLAVNADEEKELVQGFVNSRNLSNLVVLLDPGNKMSADFMANEVLPTTMVVGKDGIVRKVIAGGGPQAEAELHAAVEAALKGE